MSPFLLVGCRPEDPPPKPPAGGTCDSVSHQTLSGGTDVVLEHAGCGVIALRETTPTGEVPFTVTMFTGGDRFVIYVEASEDGVLREVVARGTLEVEGAGATFGHGLPERGEGGSPPSPGVVTGHGAASWGRDGATALVGALDGTLPPPVIELGDGTFEVRWQGLDLPLDGGRGVYLDPLTFVAGPTPDAVWADWAALAADQTGATRRDPLPWGVELDPGDDVAAILDDWTGAAILLREGFVDPAAAADLVVGAGGRAGLVARPFAVDPAADVVALHPEWLVLDEGGSPIEVRGSFVLDASDPDAVAWAARALEVELGPADLLVVDGLADAATPGARDEGPLGWLAVRSGLGQLRRALRGVTLVAGDAPPLAVLGVVDGLRTDPPAGAPDAAWAGSIARSPLGPWLPLSPGASVWPSDVDRASAGLAHAALAGSAVAAPTSDPAWGTVAAALAADARAPSLPEGADWSRVTADDATVLLGFGAGPSTFDGPGGREIVRGLDEAPGERTLSAGSAEVWWP